MIHGSVGDLFKERYLKEVKAHVVSDGGGLCMVLLVWEGVEPDHRPVGLQRALLEEDQESTGTAHLQVSGQQAGDGFVDQGPGAAI